MISDQIKVGTPGISYQFGRFQLVVRDDGHTTLSSDGHPVALTTTALTILRVLVEKQGRFVKTRHLLDCVSQSPDATENIVHGAVHELRRTLIDASLIRTERLKGYCFVGEVTVQPDEGLGVSSGEPGLVIVDPAEGPVEDIRPRRLPSRAEVPPSVDNQPSNPSDTSDRRRDPFVVVALLVSAAVLLLPFGLAFASASWASVTRQLGFIQALMILVAIGYDFSLSEKRDPKNAEPEIQRALIAVQQFRRSWRLLLGSWCCLYVALLVSQAFGPSAGDTHSSQWQPLQIITTFLNNCSALALVLCYIVLNRSTIIRVAGADVEDLPLKRGLYLVGGFGLLEATLVALFGIYGQHNYAGYLLFGADLLSGIIGGIAMALCVSRLDSRLLDAGRLLSIIPIVLYLYVVIQPFYPLLNWTFPWRQGVPQHFDLWIMQLAFMLKSVMYIYVTRLFKSGRFLFYMIHARRIYETVDIEWSGFKSVNP